MGRSAQWRDFDPFRITPEFADASSGDHFEGTSYRWEQSASGYVRELGELYYNLDREDNDPDITVRDNRYVVSEELYDDTEENEEVLINGNTWNVDQKYSLPLPIVGETYFFDLSRIVEGQKYDIWKIYNYSFLNWNFLREEKRKHVE